MEEKDLEEVSEAISNNISGEIIEAKKQAKIRIPELAVTAVTIVIGVIFYCLNYVSLLALALVLFGAMWNFFTEANKLFACIMAFFVCTIFAVLSVKLNMYGQAFLHVGFYLPTQLIFYYENKNNKDVSIDSKKELKLLGLICAGVSLLLLSACLCFVLHAANEAFYISDGIATAFLMLSVFLSNGRYREYWAVRIGALAVAIVVWLNVALHNNFGENVIVILLLFGMYMVMDLIKFVMWEARSIKDNRIKANEKSE